VIQLNWEPDKDMSPELIELQMKMMHQQEELESMSNTVIQQGKQIEKLNILIEALKTKFDEMAISSTPIPVDEKPPHY